jgi:HEPN domain-containing protein
MNGAEEFLEAATKVCKPPVTARNKLRLKINMTAYYLLGHSIELSLKAFLFGRGIKYNKLRYKPYGHDLSKLITVSRKRRLGVQVKLTNNEIDLIKLLSISYSAKLLEYTETGFYKLPEYGVLHEIATKLVAGIRP